jgi:hypothetical protein
MKLTTQLHLVLFQNVWSCTARFTHTYNEWYLVKQGDNFTMPCTLEWGWQVPPNRWLLPNYTASHPRRQETQTIHENTKQAQIGSGVLRTEGYWGITVGC